MRVLLVDGFNLVRRLYEARPHADQPLDEEVITSAAQSFHRALRTHEPSHACCLFDSHEPTWRHQLYPDYKANRKPTPQPLLDAIPRFEDAFLALGVRSILIKGYESDDVIATMARIIDRAGGQVTILSTDKNFLQLLDDHVTVYDHFNEFAFTPAWVLDKYGVRHDQLVDYWALTGDASGNVKGVPKIGPKHARELINQYGTLDALLAEPPANKTGDRIRAHRQDAELSRRLVRLKTDVEVGTNLKQLRYIPD